LSSGEMCQSQFRKRNFTYGKGDGSTAGLSEVARSWDKTIRPFRIPVFVMLNR